jgi:hypothetical protein
LVTQLLQQWSGGSKDALDELMPVVYEQLHKLASNCLRAERPDHTLRAIALVHEGYLRLVGTDVAWETGYISTQYLPDCCAVFLVDHARTRNRQKRGAGAERITLDEAIRLAQARMLGSWK